MRNPRRNQCAAAPLPCRGGVGGGVSIFLTDKILQTPTLPLPLRGRGAAARSFELLFPFDDFLKWAQSFYNQYPKYVLQ